MGKKSKKLFAEEMGYRNSNRALKDVTNKVVTNKRLAELRIKYSHRETLNRKDGDYL